MAALVRRIGAGLCLAAALLCPQSPSAGAVAAPQGPPADAAAVLAATRQALGGEEKLSGVRTFVATGRTRQVRGNNLVPIEFEIACELPDKFVRRDEIPAQESGPTSSGFNGDSLIQVPLPQVPPPGPTPGSAPPARAAAPSGGATASTAGTPPTSSTPPAAGMPATAAAPGSPAPSHAGGPPPAPPDPRKMRVTTLKQDFVRLTLGMFASSFASYPLSFTSAGRAEAPQGTAEILDVKGPGTFALKLFVNSATHLPIMVSWTVPATNVVMAVQGQPAPENVAPGSVVVQAPPLPAPTATKEEQEKYTRDVQELRKKALAGAKPVEHRIYYAEYREVSGGIRFPFRVRRAIGGETVEETNFDTFKINPRIDPRKFESR